MKKFLRACTLVLGFAILSSCSVFSTRTDLHQDMIQGTVIKHIREKGCIWELFSNDYHMVIGDTLYVDDDQWERFSADSRADRALIAHENEHAVRQMKEGTWSWICKYLFDPSFRLQEEQAAIEVEWRYRIQDGQRFTKFDWEYYCKSEARSMAATIYSMTTYEEAYKWVNELFVKLYKEVGLEAPSE